MCKEIGDCNFPGALAIASMSFLQPDLEAVGTEGIAPARMKPSSEVRAILKSSSILVDAFIFVDSETTFFSSSFDPERM